MRNRVMSELQPNKLQEELCVNRHSLQACVQLISKLNLDNELPAIEQKKILRAM